MTTIGLARSFRSAFDALTATLLDVSRRDRAMLLLLAAYAAAWTLYGAIAKSSQDLHPDMTELIAWSRDPSLEASAAWRVAGTAVVRRPAADGLVVLFAGDVDADARIMDRLAFLR